MAVDTAKLNVIIIIVNFAEANYSGKIQISTDLSGVCNIMVQNDNPGN